MLAYKGIDIVDKLWGYIFYNIEYGEHVRFEVFHIFLLNAQ